MIFNAFMLAFRQIRRNTLRAFLTMLGIIIGTGSVIVMISLGNGTSKQIQDSISSLGSNILIIMPARGLDTSGQSLRRYFNQQEVDIIDDRIYGIRALAPISNGSALIQYKQYSRETETYGVTSGYFVAGNWEIASGREFTDEEYKSGANVCIVGDSVKNALFNNTEPLGAKIKIGNKHGSIICECVGVLGAKGQGAMGNDQDDVILFPLKSYLRTLGREKQSINNINRIMISLNDGVDSKQKTEEIKETFREIRNIDGTKTDNFEIMDTKQIEETLAKTTQMLTLFLGAIAGVSLIVGGIGIMNIMLVSVTERTKEIGTRLAIGALEKEVLLQFLIESIVISSLGGFIGIVLSFIISFALAQMMNLPFVYSVSVAIIAFIFSAFIGVLFGYLPAKRASKLNPIDALRHE
ncbi:multidrug ABC transporter substrate-binding protein [Helicobacter sp. 16-1353]|uniref:ABC transporter permease n=1 Tax=Helicobacter sp. 16-1353 TaxID=2004996 RepID=UPI000DCB6CF2|nr:ABC transporter permease [Helicobacter sp. 16-1353]RAX53210.1 multidrug ABC transporter substrate-binding protein [Helicobacter sp. 16-1353]